MKKVFSSLAALSLILSLTACGPKEESSTPATPTSTTAGDSSSTPDDNKGGDKSVFNLWAFTDEVPKMVKKYAELNKDFGDKYEIKDTIIATTNGEYQPALDQALLAGGDEAPDMYCAEAAFIVKYSQGDMSEYAATYDELGIDTDNKVKEAKIAQYTVDLGSRDGKVVALGYQATGGAFIYRRSIANEVFGTDDYKAVAKEIGPGWDQFWKAADKLKAKGYGIISGDGDIWHAIENSSDTGWVVDGKLNIDPKREAFLDVSKLLNEKDYYNDTTDWQEGWFSDMRGEGKKGILGFFGPAWLINYSMAENCGDKKETEEHEGTWGDWAVCDSPVGFFWGGTWVIGNKNSKIKEDVGKVINWITLDTTDDGLQYKWANGTLYGEGGTKDAVASAAVMERSDGTVGMLGGQNMFDVFIPANEYANGKCLTQYDETINAKWRDQVRMYAHGQKSKDDAIKDFKMTIKETLDLDS